MGWFMPGMLLPGVHYFQVTWEANTERSLCWGNGYLEGSFTMHLAMVCNCQLCLR